MSDVQTPDMETLMFFDGHRDALPLYLTFMQWLCDSLPSVDRRVQKTQITFFNRRVYACVSFARVRRKAELPAGWMVLTLGLPAPLESDRVAAKTEPCPGRWTHHIVVSRPSELDDELLSWVRQAYDFANRP